MIIGAPDSLTLGLRTLATLARRGPLDVARLARLHHSRLQQTAAVIAVLEGDGLIYRLTDQTLFVVTRRGAALIGEGRRQFH